MSTVKNLFEKGGVKRPNPSKHPCTVPKIAPRPVSDNAGFKILNNTLAGRYARIAPKSNLGTTGVATNRAILNIRDHGVEKASPPSNHTIVVKSVKGSVDEDKLHSGALSSLKMCDKRFTGTSSKSDNYNEESKVSVTPGESAKTCVARFRGHIRSIDRYKNLKSMSAKVRGDQGVIKINSVRENKGLQFDGRKARRDNLKSISAKVRGGQEIIKSEPVLKDDCLNVNAETGMAAQSIVKPAEVTIKEEKLYSNFVKTPVISNESSSGLAQTAFKSEHHNPNEELGPTIYIKTPPNAPSMSDSTTSSFSVKRENQAIFQGGVDEDKLRSSTLNCLEMRDKSSCDLAQTAAETSSKSDNHSEESNVSVTPEESAKTCAASFRGHIRNTGRCKNLKSMSAKLRGDQEVVKINSARKNKGAHLGGKSARYKYLKNISEKVRGDQEVIKISPVRENNCLNLNAKIGMAPQSIVKPAEGSVKVDKLHSNFVKTIVISNNSSSGLVLTAPKSEHHNPNEQLGPTIYIKTPPNAPSVTNSTTNSFSEVRENQAILQGNPDVRKRTPSLLSAKNCETSVDDNGEKYVPPSEGKANASLGNDGEGFSVGNKIYKEPKSGKGDDSFVGYTSEVKETTNSPKLPHELVIKSIRGNVDEESIHFDNQHSLNEENDDASIKPCRLELGSSERNANQRDASENTDMVKIVSGKPQSNQASGKSASNPISKATEKSTKESGIIGKFVPIAPKPSLCADYTRDQGSERCPEKKSEAVCSAVSSGEKNSSKDDLSAGHHPTSMGEKKLGVAITQSLNLDSNAKMKAKEVEGAYKVKGTAQEPKPVLKRPKFTPRIISTARRKLPCKRQSDENVNEPNVSPEKDLPKENKAPCKGVISPVSLAHYIPILPKTHPSMNLSGKKWGESCQEEKSKIVNSKPSSRLNSSKGEISSNLQTTNVGKAGIANKKAMPPRSAKMKPKINDEDALTDDDLEESTTTPQPKTPEKEMKRAISRYPAIRPKRPTEKSKLRKDIDSLMKKYPAIRPKAAPTATSTLPPTVEPEAPACKRQLDGQDTGAESAGETVRKKPYVCMQENCDDLFWCNYKKLSNKFLNQVYEKRVPQKSAINGNLSQTKLLLDKAYEFTKSADFNKEFVGNLQRFGLDADNTKDIEKYSFDAIILMGILDLVKKDEFSELLLTVQQIRELKKRNTELKQTLRVTRLSILKERHSRNSGDTSSNEAESCADDILSLLPQAESSDPLVTSSRASPDLNSAATCDSYANSDDDKTGNFDKTDFMSYLGLQSTQTKMRTKKRSFKNQLKVLDGKVTKYMLNPSIPLYSVKNLYHYLKWRDRHQGRR